MIDHGHPRIDDLRHPLQNLGQGMPAGLHENDAKNVRGGGGPAAPAEKEIHAAGSDGSIPESVREFSLTPAEEESNFKDENAGASPNSPDRPTPGNVGPPTPRENPRSNDIPSLPNRGPGFWIPALVLPLLLLSGAAAVFLLGSGPVAVILSCALLLAAVSSLAFYDSGIRCQRIRKTKQ